MTRLFLLIVFGLGTLVAAASAYLLTKRPLPVLTEPAVSQGITDTEIFESFELRHADLSSYAQFISRPPFSPTRAPYRIGQGDEVEVATEPAPLTNEEPPEVRLLGIFADGAERVAVFAPENGPELYFMRNGGEFDGWRIEKVDDSRVTLRKDSREVEVLLFEPR